MTDHHCVLVLADQLDWSNPALAEARPGIDTIVMAEVAEEANYVRHNRHKIVLLFSAMRHFAEDIQARGFSLRYVYLHEQAAQPGGGCSPSPEGDGCDEAEALLARRVPAVE